MKKFFCGVASMALLAGAPVTLTSCNDDDVNTVLSLIDLLFTSADELANTAWLASDNSLAIEFGAGNQGYLYESAVMDDNGAVAQPFTYQLDTQNNLLVLTLNSGTRSYTVQEFTQGVSLTLSYGGTIFKMSPITE